MSKIEELRAKYPRVTKFTFEKFVSGDKTKTKKYLPFMLKTWVNKTGQISNSDELVQLVNMFDELTSYIDNKDIYSKEYEDISRFLEVLNEAMAKKEEATFIKEDNVNVLFENDDILLIQPKTHKGSLKYGAKTKWCTASRKDPGTFERYSKTGFLSYLICKNESKGDKYSKVAFYSRNSTDPLIDAVETYDVMDKNVDVSNLVNAGWEVHDIFTILSIHRASASNWKRVQKSKEILQSTVNILSSIDFTTITQAMKIVENSENYDYINTVRNQINQFIEKIPVKL